MEGFGFFWGAENYYDGAFLNLYKLELSYYFGGMAWLFNRADRFGQLLSSLLSSAAFISSSSLLF